MGVNQLLMTLAPKCVVRWFASPYIAGSTRAEALAVADSLWSGHGVRSTIDLLGEAVTRREQVKQTMAEYRALVGSLGERPYAWTSVKLSAMGQDIDEGWCVENAEELLKLAAEQNSFIRFDMEDYTTVDSTLRIYREMRERGYENVGIVLQSRLWRTPEDIEALAELEPKPNVRICIGIYPEPPEIAETSKPKMKQRLLEQTTRMLEHGFYVAIATHDEASIAQVRSTLAERGWGPERAEFQMLLGVPRAKLQSELVREGWTVRLYIPYGRDWYPYSKRRLMESPDIVGHVLRNVFARKRRLKTPVTTEDMPSENGKTQP